MNDHSRIHPPVPQASAQDRAIILAICKLELKCAQCFPISSQEDHRYRNRLLQLICELEEGDQQAYKRELAAAFRDGVDAHMMGGVQ